MQKKCRSILICSPTGSGKTALTAHMLKTAASRSMASWFIVHRRELIKQSIGAFDKIGLRHGVIANGFSSDFEPLTQVCSIGTLQNRYMKYKEPRLIVWDECHHMGAASWEKIFKGFPNSYHIGLTATPYRMDGKGLGKYFDEMISGPSVSDLIEDGYLSDYKLYAPANPDLHGVKKRMGDYVKSDLAQAMDKPTITGSAIKEYKKHADGKRAVVFSVSISHSLHVVGQFRQAGVSAEHVDGSTPRDERDAALHRFATGKTKVLSNVDLFGEGFDVPSIECAILLRPTQSLSLYLQQVGRALRIHEGKERAIILDHSGNAQKHGLPDEERSWSLEGVDKSNKKSKTDRVSITICPYCFAAQPSGLSKCQSCGYDLPTKDRRVDEVEGDLIEVDPSEVRRQRKVEQAQAESISDLIAIGKQRGYKNPYFWAKNVFAGRQKKKLRGG